MNRPPLGLVKNCRVLRVLDGDTVDVEIVTRATIRLVGCWAPESRTLNLQEKHRGIAAKNNLVELTQIGNGVVFIPTESAQSLGDVLTLGRVLGRVWMDGQEDDLSTQQVLAGHATATKAG